MTHERVIRTKEKLSFSAMLIDLGKRGWAIGIIRPGRGEKLWDGAALFPRALKIEADKRFDDLETDVDIEDLVREWGDPEGQLLRDFEAFLGREKGKKEKRKKKQRKLPVYVPYESRQYPKPADARSSAVELLPLSEYDTIIVSFSGGKDSIACALHLLELGVPASKIELWHQAVDGQPGKDPRLFDWPCTEAYCEAFAKALGMPIYFQWKEGGFQREMLRDATPTAPTSFQLPSGQTATVGGEGPPGTRMKFPQVAADLAVRWCSAYLKIDVASRVFSNDPRFKGNVKVLMCTGERRQESGNRARYAEVDEHKSSTKTRRIDQWRPVLSWFEEDVWDIMARFRIRPHPAYYLGWSRVSCFPCIFGDPHQWASVGALDSALLAKLGDFEKRFGVTLRRDGTLAEAAARGVSYVDEDDRPYVKQALSEHYRETIVVPAHEEWELPKGAFGHSGGPT